MKLKNSVRKKLLTSLLIGATLSSITGNAAFANSCKTTDLSESKPVSSSSSQAQKLIKQMSSRSKELKVYDVKKYKIAFVNFNGDLYLYNYDGSAFLTGKVTVADDIFYFAGNDFQSVEGWYNISGKGRFYFDPYSHKALRDCLTFVNGERFHFNETGAVDIGLINVDGKTYIGKNKTGALVTGWYSIGGHRYYLNPYTDMSATTGWYQDGNAGFMHFEKDGAMSDGIVNVQDKKEDKNHKNGLYLFKHHGNGQNSYVATGFYSPGDGNRYYFNPEDSGRALTNAWFPTGSAPYKRDGVMYFDGAGHMANGIVTIEGRKYLFTRPKGVSIKLTVDSYRDYGWYTELNGNRYYFNPDDGSLRSINTTPKGAAVTGTQIIDGVKYQFDNNGVLIK